MLPFVCERCGFSFFRNLDEYFKLGSVRCPRCQFRIELNTDEIDEIAGMIDSCHQAEDMAKDPDDEGDGHENTPPTLR
jgi:DNA-directed RNA polymerase subunit RPC12/RpoP